MSQAFKLLEDRERYQSWIEDTRQKVEVAVAELDRGEGVELDLAIDSLEERLLLGQTLRYRQRLQQKFQSAKENT